jgi:hypothetical protein
MTFTLTSSPLRYTVTDATVGQYFIDLANQFTHIANRSALKQEASRWRVPRRVLDDVGDVSAFGSAGQGFALARPCRAFHDRVVFPRVHAFSWLELVSASRYPQRIVPRSLTRIVRGESVEASLGLSDQGHEIRRALTKWEALTEEFAVEKCLMTRFR